MNEIQSKILELLLEIDEICRKNNIKYYLNEQLALGAVRNGGFLPDSCSASILMTDSDCKKFISVYKKFLKSDRSIEYLGNNPDFMSFHVKYLNENTLYFPAKEWESNNKNGIRVNIHRLASVPKDKSMAKKYIESETLLRKYLSRTLKWDKTKIPDLYNLATTPLPSDEQPEEYYVRTPKYINNLKFKPRTFPASIFNESKKLFFEGHMLSIAGDTDAFLTICYGSEWKTKNVPCQVPGKTIIADGNIPYKKYFEELEKYISKDEFAVRLNRKLINDDKLKNVFKDISLYYDIVKNIHNSFIEGKPSDTVRELQLKLLTLIKEFDSICKKHNITYYADSGTALGAVRHKGFLPWDDDVDLIMTRENWDKLLSVIDSELGSDRELVCFERNPDYHSSVCRYVDKNTTRLAYSMCLSTFAAGHCIDIFVLDPISDTNEEQDKYINDMLAYMEYRSSNFVINENFDNNLYQNYISRAVTIGDNIEADKLFRQELFYRYTEKETSHYIRRWNTRVYVHHRDMFGEPVYYSFEDMKMPVMPGYNRLFIECYGNGWPLIPEESEQITHDSIYCSNLDIGYLDYVNAYLPLLNTDDLKQKLSERKRLQAEGSADSVFYKSSLLILHGLHLSMNLNKRFKDFKKIFNNKEYEKLNSFFEPYFKLQCARNYWDNKILIPLNDKLLYCALYLLSIRGDFFYADKILSLREGCEKSLPNKLKAMRSYLNAKWELTDAIAQNDTNKVNGLIDKWLVHYPDDKDFNTEFFKRELSEKTDAETLSQLQKRSDRLSSLSYGDETFRKISADILMKRGLKGEALSIYRDIYNNTRNGLIKSQIESML